MNSSTLNYYFVSHWSQPGSHRNESARWFTGPIVLSSCYSANLFPALTPTLFYITENTIFLPASFLPTGVWASLDNGENEKVRVIEKPMYFFLFQTLQQHPQWLHLLSSGRTAPPSGIQLLLMVKVLVAQFVELASLFYSFCFRLVMLPAVINLQSASLSMTDSPAPLSPM